MRNRPLPWLLLILASSLACGGGGNAVPEPPGGSSNLVASFIAAEPGPGADSITLAQGSVSNNIITIQVNVTDTDDVFGADFVVNFDPAFVEFLNWSQGSLLEQGGQTPLYLVSPQPGEVLVGASRLSGAVDVIGTRNLINLTFRVLQAGSSAMDFENMALLDAQSPAPQTIPNLNWFGGDLQAN